MLTYNDKMKHSATGMTPKEARKDNNEFRAMLNVASKAKKERIYPTLEVGDKVKIMRKKGITEKERTSHWLNGYYVVNMPREFKGQKRTSRILRFSIKLPESRPTRSTPLEVVGFFRIS